MARYSDYDVPGYSPAVGTAPGTYRSSLIPETTAYGQLGSALGELILGGAHALAPNMFKSPERKALDKLIDLYTAGLQTPSGTIGELPEPVKREIIKNEFRDVPELIPQMTEQMTQGKYYPTPQQLQDQRIAEAKSMYTPLARDYMLGTMKGPEADMIRQWQGLPDDAARQKFFGPEGYIAAKSITGAFDRQVEGFVSEAIMREAMDLRGKSGLFKDMETARKGNIISNPNDPIEVWANRLFAEGKDLPVWEEWPQWAKDYVTATKGMTFDESGRPIAPQYMRPTVGQQMTNTLGQQRLGFDQFKHGLTSLNAQKDALATQITSRQNRMKTLDNDLNRQVNMIEQSLDSRDSDITSMGGGIDAYLQLGIPYVIAEDRVTMDRAAARQYRIKKDPGGNPIFDPISKKPMLEMIPEISRINDEKKLLDVEIKSLEADLSSVNEAIKAETSNRSTFKQRFSITETEMQMGDVAEIDRLIRSDKIIPDLGKMSKEEAEQVYQAWSNDPDGTRKKIAELIKDGKLGVLDATTKQPIPHETFMKAVRGLTDVPVKNEKPTGFSIPPPATPPKSTVPKQSDVDMINNLLYEQKP